jgi:hypothetical protein
MDKEITAISAPSEAHRRVGKAVEKLAAKGRSRSHQIEPWKHKVNPNEKTAAVDVSGMHSNPSMGTTPVRVIP